MTATTKPVTSRDLVCRLRIRYGGTEPPNMIGPPKWTLLTEIPVPALYEWGGVTTRASYNGGRRIDAVAVGLQGATRYLIHGFEIKVSRSDLLQELKDPDKAKSGAAACDTWSLVLADQSLLRPTDPIPDDWGILVGYGKKLREIREPKVGPRLRDPLFVAALIGRAMQTPSYRRSLGYWAGYRHGITRFGR